MGPLARLVPASPTDDVTVADPLSWFRAGSLDLGSVGPYLIVSTPDQLRVLTSNRERYRALLETLTVADGQGSGPADRFQSVNRWRREDIVAVPSSVEIAPREENRSIQWYESIGWPSPAGATVERVKRSALTGWSWTLGLATLGLGVVLRRRTPALRLWVVVTLGAAAILIASWGSAIALAVATGTVCGAIGSSAFWLGRSLRSAARPDEPPERPSASGRSNTLSSRIEVAILVTALVPLGAWPQPGHAQLTPVVREDRADPTDDALLVVVPHDGTGTATGHVWITRRDDERLRSWAARSIEHHASSESSLWAVAADHRVHFEDGSARIDSLLRLELDGPGPAPWTLPLGAGLYDFAELDGKDVPLAIRPDGPAAVVWVSGSGNHLLKLRRQVLSIKKDEGEVLDVSVNQVPGATIQVSAAPIDRMITVRSARGRVSATDGGELIGSLGPSDRIEVRWAAPMEGLPPILQGTAEGVLLWVAEPAGDRVTVRITYREPGEPSKIRVRLGPGIEVQSASVPGLVDSELLGSPEAPVWVGRVDPPLKDGATLALGLWRPVEPGSPADPRTTGPSSRTIPHVEPLDVQVYLGTLGFQRPGDWTGRLGDMFGAEVVPDEQFARLWGNLPANGSTLAGALRFASTPEVTVITGPIPPNAVVSQAVNVEIQPGRLDTKVEATLVPRDGRVREVRVRIPERWQAVRIDGDGLSDWSRAEPDLLRLRFDGAGAVPGTIHLEGWVPVESDPMSPDSQAHRMPIPWPEWLDLDQAEGTLLVRSSGRIPFEVEPAIEVTTEDAPAAVTRSTTSPALFFRVNTAREAGQLRWYDEGPKVHVVAHGLLTLYPENAELSVALRYRISGGPLRSLILRLPTEWAENVQVLSDGMEQTFQAKAENGYTDLTLNPDEPMWGTRHFVVQAMRPFDPTRGITFPDLIPMMRREQQEGFETYLMLANATGRFLAPEGSSHVQAIDVSKFADVPVNPPDGADLHAYYVLEDDWRLAVPPVSDRLETATAGPGSTWSMSSARCPPTGP